MRDLTKWPRLLVVGKPVSKELAQEIQIRTWTNWYGTNAQMLAGRFMDIAGIEHDSRGWPDWKSENKWRKRFRVLDLEYLNNSWIYSSWIGGPHGWIDWHGNIGTNNYNIGKWPSYEHVLLEWQTIAKAWPELDLRSQLITDEGSGDLAVEYKVREGTVDQILGPPDRISIPTELSEAEIVSTVFMSPEHREAGCTEEILKEAIQTTEESLKRKGLWQ